MAALTQNAITQILDRAKAGQESNNDFCPVIQITEVRTVKRGGQERVKLMLSDGGLIITGLVSHDCNQGTIADLTNLSIIKVTEYIVQELKSTKPGNQKVNRVLVLINFQKIGELQQVIGNPRKIEDVVEPNSPYTASSTSNGTMPAAQGIQPMQQTAMYGAPSGVYAAAPGGAPMGQVQQQMAGGYGQPAQAYAQPPGPGQYSNVQQPGPTPYGNAPHPGPTPYGNAQQATLGTYGNAPPQQYGSNGGPNAAYGGNQGGAPQGIPARYDMHRGPVTQNSNAMNITKISDITPFQNNWTIKGRCTVKSDMRRWNKNGKQGCVFNFDLLDESGEIRCVCFGEVAEDLDSQIQTGKCYSLTKGTAKTMDNNKRKWNQTGHSCEISVEKYTKVEEVPEDASVAAVPLVNVKPVKISTIETAEINAFVDVIAVLDSCADVSTIQRRDGSEAQKRSMTLRDDSGKAVEFTMWGDKATSTGTQLFDAFRAGQHPVLVVKGARVGDFGGKNLGSVGSTQVYIDATEVDGVQQMQQWFNAGGATQATQNLSRTGGRADRRVTTEMLVDEHLGSGQPAWVKIAGALAAVRESPLTYPACPLERNGRTCNKKLQSNDDGSDMFTCETCAQSTMPVYRYVLNCQLVDFEGSKEHVSTFGDQGESLMKMPADQAHQNFEQGETDELHQYLTRSVLWRPKVVKLKCAEDTYNDETRIKFTVNSIEDTDFVQESQGLIEMIEDIQGGRPIKAMQPKPQKSFQGPGMNNSAFGGPVVPGPFGASAGANPNQMFNPNESYMQQQQAGFGMQPQYGLGGQPQMYQPQMGMQYQQQPQQMMHQQQPSNAMAFL